MMLFWKNISPRYYNHTANPFLKSTFEEVWKKEGRMLDKVCLNKFRSNDDVNQYLMKAWQIYSGKFIPKSCNRFGTTITLSDDVDLSIINSNKYDMLCINDGVVNDFDKIKESLIDEFEKAFPDKSSFEK